jgi:glycosyltransferase involved in cell wall biosynthesis
VKVTIVLPFINLTGGVRVMLDYANLLQRAGHDTTVVYPTWPYQFQWTRRQQWTEFQKHRRHIDWVPWFNLHAKLRRVPLIRNAFMPKADVVVATAWPTAHDVSRLSPSRGRHVHIVMHHETGSGPEAPIRDVYRLPFHRIAFSDFVRGSVKARFGCHVDQVVTNGVDTSLFYPDGEPRPRKVFMMYHPDPRKGGDDGIRALTLLQAEMPDTEFVVCGTVRPEGSWPTGMPFEFHPSDASVRRHFSTSTVFLYPSRYEGFGLPPLEAMACGCPSVTTDVGAIPEFVVDRDNGLVVPAGDVNGMVRALRETLMNSALRSRMSAAGLRTANRLSLARVGSLFVDALERAARA